MTDHTLEVLSFEGLHYDSKQKSCCFYGLLVCNLITSQLQNLKKFFKCCNSENNDDIENALPGII